MDLLAELTDLGQSDQLTSAREENSVLHAKVKELTVRVHELLAENQALKAEVEIFRAESAVPSFSRLAPVESGDCVGESKDSLVGIETDVADDFVTSGNGLYPDEPVVTLPHINGLSNPLCCALHPDDSLLATGGADATLSLCQWGSALAPGEESSAKAVNASIKIPCDGPVICTAFAQVNQGRGFPVVAAGCMDGTVRLAHCGMGFDAPKDRILRPESVGSESNSNGIKEYGIKHGKYVKNVVWSPSAPIVASASADGTIQLTRVGNIETMMDDDDGNNNSGMVSMEVVQSMHFDGPVEAMCFLDNGDTLCCYVRGTSYLSYFDLKNGCKQRKFSINGGAAGTANFDEHVSFSILSLVPSPNKGGKYLAAATDASRNIIFEAGTDRIVRDLYGHKNDGYSNPKIAWSSSGQYLYGNVQDDGCVAVWDIASSSIVKRLDEGMGGHTGFVRDIYSSSTTDTVVTVSFDKSAKVWLRGL